MLILQILGGLAAFGAALWLLHRFNEHCHKKFGYRFLNFKSFLWSSAALLLILLGVWWRSSAAASGGDVLNGIILMIVGGGIALGVAYQNFRRTNVAYGVGGTALQVVVFSVVGYLGIVVLFLFVIFFVIGRSGATPVYFID